MARFSEALRNSVSARWRRALDLSTTTLVLIAAIVVLWNTWANRPNQRRSSVTTRNAIVVIGRSPTLGNANAKVAVVEYSDFECQFCATASHEVLPLIKAEYLATGRVLLAFRHFPLTSVHRSALLAAVAAECAAQQDRFWPLHDRLYQGGTGLDALSLREHVIAVGANVTRWDACMSAGDARKTVDVDAASARALGIQGTPTFLIGSVRPGGRVNVFKQISGVGTVAEWRSASDEALRLK